MPPTVYTTRYAMEECANMCNCVRPRFGLAGQKTKEAPRNSQITQRYSITQSYFITSLTVGQTTGAPGGSGQNYTLQLHPKMAPQLGQRLCLVAAAGTTLQLHPKMAPQLEQRLRLVAAAGTTRYNFTQRWRHSWDSVSAWLPGSRGCRVGRRRWRRRCPNS